MSSPLLPRSGATPGHGLMSGARWAVWLPVVVLVSLAHAAVWHAYAARQSGQTLPQPLPSVQIALVALPVPREMKPASPETKSAPPLARPPARPKRMPTETQKPVAPTSAAAETAPAEPVAAASETIASAPPVTDEALTQPLYNAAYLSNPPPTYPLAARRRGIEGTVVVRAQILEDGNCHQASLSKSSGHEMLDRAAVAAVKSWRFVPAKRGIQTISAWVEVPITFRLTRQNAQTQSL